MVKKIAGISASLVGTHALTSILGLLFWTLAARSFAAAEVGVAGAAVSLMTFLASLGSLGLGTLLISRLPVTAATQRRVLVRTSLAVTTAVTAALAAVVPVVAVFVFGAENLRPLVDGPGALALFVGGTAVMALVLVLDQTLLTIGNGIIQTERNVVASVVKIGALLGLAHLGADTGMTVFLAWGIGTVLSLPLVSWRTRGGPGRGQALIDLRTLQGLARPAMSHHALNTTLQSALQILPIIVTLAVSAETNAYFTTALLLSGFVFALPYAIAIAVFASARGDERAVVSNLPLTAGASIGLSLLAWIALLPLAPLLLSFFGSDYAGGGTVLLQVLALAGAPFVIKDHYVALRRVQDRTTAAVRLLAVFLVLELAAAAIGAATGGALGLSVAWVAVLYAEAAVLTVPLVRTWLAHRAKPPALPTYVGDQTVVLALPPGMFLFDATSPMSAVRPQGDVRSRHRKAPKPRSEGPDKGFGAAFLLMCFGVLAMGAAVIGSRILLGADGLTAAFWVLGQVLVVLPPAYRILLTRTGNTERIVLVAAAGVLLQLARTVLDPTRYSFHDEQLHLSTWRQLHESGALFGPNPLLPVSGYYPGLEILTDAIVRLTGFDVFVSGTIVLVVTRVLLMLALMAVAKVAAGSMKAAAVAAMVYLCNPQMFFFSSQYSYQTLALPLALATVYVFVSRRRDEWRSLLLPVLGIAAVAVTHHLTAILLVAAFAVWLTAEIIVGRASRGSRGSKLRTWHRAEIRHLFVVTVAGIAANGAMALVPGSPVVRYLADIFTSSGSGLARLAETGETRAVFSNPAGVAPAPWERVLLIAAVLITTAALLIAVLELWRRLHRGQAFGLVLALLALLYPIIPGGHFNAATAEMGDRAAGFVFIGLGVVIGMWAGRTHLTRRRAFAMATTITMVFLGNVILGAGPTARQLPGPYLVAADSRSMDADNLHAAEWLEGTLPPGQRVFADRVAGLLASSVGNQYTVRHLSSGVEASRLLLAPDFTDEDVELIRQARIDYVVVDSRISESLPVLEVYVEHGEIGMGTRTEPVPDAALHKLAAAPAVDLIYDNGSVQIYDVEALR